MLKVSILVPVYGVEQFIERCSRSLFEQTYSCLEYVFVDDCSPDNSILILNKIINEYPERATNTRILRHDKNRGLAASRNTAISAACGTFVIHVDSDDWLEPNAVQLLVDKQLETGADIVSGSAYMHTRSGIEDLYEPVYQDKEEMVLQQLKYSWDHVIWRRLIRRSLYLDYGIKCLDGCDMAEDRYQMALLSFYANSFSRIDEFVYNYEKRNEGSIMAQRGGERIVRKGFQYLSNWIGIKDFFFGKNALFYKEAAKQTVLYSQNVLDWVLKFDGYSAFHHIVSIIDRLDKEYFPLIGWEIKGVKGALLHCYPFMKICSINKRANRVLKKKIKRICH